MPTNEETQAQLSYELAVYREQIAMLRRETERVSLTSIDLNNALKTVEGLSNDRVFIPIGGGVLVRGTITDTQVLVPIGAGYLLEMKKETATVELHKRIDATNKAVEKLTLEFNKINEKLRGISSQLGQLQAQARLDQKVEENTKDDYL